MKRALFLLLPLLFSAELQEREERCLCIVKLLGEAWVICGQDSSKSQLGIVLTRAHFVSVFSRIYYICALNLQYNSFNTIIIHS